ncbi:MAG: hypothetical protein KGM98_00260 [Bacteroidota bacterium]|nr:hypothetical protein [Bacteroidota bacterium]
MNPKNIGISPGAYHRTISKELISFEMEKESSKVNSYLQPLTLQGAALSAISFFLIEVLFLQLKADFFLL